MVMQLELPMPRTRVKLEDAQTPRKRVRLEDAAPEVPVVNIAQGARFGALFQDGDNPAVLGEFYPDAHLSRTGWSTAFPPVHGFWEVTDHKTGALLERWWYDHVPACWTPHDGERPNRKAAMMHDEFREHYAWRGLCAPHPDVYPTPPYRGELLMKYALENGGTLKTTFMKMHPVLGDVVVPRSRARL